MKTPNLEILVSAMRSLRVSNEFLQGALFVLGGVLKYGRLDVPEQEVAWGLQWVVPHSIQHDRREILRRVDASRIEQVIKELVYRIGDPTLDVSLLSSSGLLPAVDLSLEEMRSVSRLYFAAVEEIGWCVKGDKLSDADAYLCGICFFSGWARVDPDRISLILRTLRDISPPALRFVFSAPLHPGMEFAEWLPTQMALQGLVVGLDETFLNVFWPFQSWVLFEDGKARPEIEDLNPLDFLRHCYAVARDFEAEYPGQITQVSNMGIGPADVPAFTGTGSERLEIFDVVKSVWGYDITDQTLSEIEKKQVNACLIFAIFCSLCRAHRSGSASYQVSRAPDQSVLEPCPNIATLEEFLVTAEAKLESFQRFSISAAIATRGGSQYQFFVSTEPQYDPKLLANMVVATRASEVFILYFANLRSLFEEDVGEFQSIVFRADSAGSAPYWFCRMLPEPHAWRIRPFNRMVEHDRNGNIAMSDISHAFRLTSEADVTTARLDLEKSQPDIQWSWEQYDE